MNLPIDVVVELLMANYTFDKGQCDHPYWIRMDSNGWRIVEADSRDELRTKVRDYLLTLVPKPVLLSECEEVETGSSPTASRNLSRWNWR